MLAAIREVANRERTDAVMEEEPARDLLKHVREGNTRLKTGLHRLAIEYGANRVSFSFGTDKHPHDIFEVLSMACQDSLRIVPRRKPQSQRSSAITRSQTSHLPVRYLTQLFLKLQCPNPCNAPMKD